MKRPAADFGPPSDHPPHAAGWRARAGRSWLGPIVTVVVLVGIGLVLVWNLQPSGKRVGDPTAETGTTEQDARPGGSASNPLLAMEHLIGRPQEKDHMEIAAVWLQGVEMAGGGPGMAGHSLPQDPNVIHLEADVKALKANPNGFPAGAWIPYLRISYKLTDQSGARVGEGPMMPMVASDGPHYGATIRMPGPGQYRLTYSIQPPDENVFGRHTDRATGVAPWWSPFTVDYPFDFTRPTR